MGGGNVRLPTPRSRLAHTRRKLVVPDLAESQLVGAADGPFIKQWSMFWKALGVSTLPPL